MKEILQAQKEGDKHTLLSLFLKESQYTILCQFRYKLYKPVFKQKEKQDIFQATYKLLLIEKYFKLTRLFFSKAVSKILQKENKAL